MINKLIGMIIALAGLAVVIFSKIILGLSFLKGLNIKMPFLIIAGLALIILGIIFIFQKSGHHKTQQESEEVPIYHGEGKKRKIVGYIRA